MCNNECQKRFSIEDLLKNSLFEKFKFIEENNYILETYKLSWRHHDVSESSIYFAN